MCANCDDLNRTVLLLGFLCIYAEQPGADQDFADVVGGALASSLPIDSAPTFFDPSGE
ncbi:hypothetical protein OG453_40515 [Streptomyces sp. NBC_01381]|uniref:hypothetical protein n=1 Tax=Streptomyces sp. NBC_01381 TaxID=2903845 RepID=UPI0022587790|nr:hypothetical protein [Streptomyces sp. NBC_01381]MCX4672856.1 hypothetical protein [Streptomyces sp. NBC_01381]